MREIDANSWHGRLFAWSYTAFGQRPPKEFDAWHYGTTVLGAIVFLVCAVVIFIVLNLYTLPLGVFVEPIWKTGARFRRLTFPGGIPIISVALPAWLAVAAWHNWATRGIEHTLGPFVVIVGLGFGLLGCFVLFNRMRRRFPHLLLRGGPPGANT